MTRNARGGAFGDLSMTLGANLNETGAGGVDGRIVSLSWAPIRKLRFSGSWSTSADSLTDQQRFDPIFYGPPTVVYDFLTGESVLVQPILGGNPDLRPPTSDQISAAITAGPITSWNLLGGVNLRRTTAIDGIGTLPSASPAIEAAFPERYRRDISGRLVSIDQRPINVSSALTETLSSNLSFAVPLGGASSGLGGASLVRVTLNHTWQLHNATTLRHGLPEMDRLSGDGGGLPRQETGLLVDGRHGRWGLNAAVRWRDGHRIRRDLGRNSDRDLVIAPFSTIDLKLSFLLERTTAAGVDGGSPRRGVGLQLGLEVANLLDDRPSARLGDGRSAPGYGRDDQDPMGRTVRLTLKRRF